MSELRLVGIKSPINVRQVSVSADIFAKIQVHLWVIAERTTPIKGEGPVANEWKLTLHLGALSRRDSVAITLANVLDASLVPELESQIGAQPLESEKKLAVEIYVDTNCSLSIEKGASNTVMFHLIVARRNFVGSVFANRLSEYVEMQ